MGLYMGSGLGSGFGVRGLGPEGKLQCQDALKEHACILQEMRDPSLEP